MAYPYFSSKGVTISGTSNSLSVDYPTVIDTDDILILSLSGKGLDPTENTPIGWTLILSNVWGGDYIGACYWKRADGTESGSIAVDFNTIYGLGICAQITSFKGCIITGTPIEVVSPNVGGTLPAETVYNAEKTLQSLGDERLSVINIPAFTTTTGSYFSKILNSYIENTADFSTRGFNLLFTEEIPNSSSNDGDIAVAFDLESNFVTFSFYLIPGASGPNVTIDADVLEIVLSIPSPTITTEGGAQADFKTQSIEDDIGNSGGSSTLASPVSDLTKAIELADNNRKTHAGDSTPTASNREGDDMAGARVLTALGTLTYYRESASQNLNMKFNTSIWEYVGPDGGDNEFIVRGRFAVVLNGTTNSVTQALTGIVNKDNCIPFITGIMNNSTADDADSATAISYLESSTLLRVQKGSIANNVTVYITLVEFTGSNWDVLHGNAESVADTGSITLYNGSDATGTATNVSAWSESIVFGHHRGDFLADGVDDALADNYPVFDVGANLQTVDWTFDANHVAVNNNRHFVHVLVNTGLNVTRFQNTSNTAGSTNVDITSAGLTDLNQALIVGTSRTSGTGTAYARGWRNYKISSLIQAQHWCTRSGNTMAHEIQIIDLSELKTIPSTGGDVLVNALILNINSNIIAPTISAVVNIDITPSILSINASLFNVTVATVKNIIISPNILNILSSIYSPIVSVSSNVNINATLLNGILTLHNPIIITTKNIIVTPNILTGNITIITPNITTGNIVGLIKVWTGSAWELKPMKVWTGLIWESKPVKRWNGTTWINI